VLAVVGIGSNLGDRLRTMRAAVCALAAVTKVKRLSPVYETAAVGGPPQGAYLNAAALLAWDGQPLALLDALEQIEVSLGRVRGERWGPRTVDLDVLWIEGMVLDHRRLVVPHPRLAERAFALRPLLDVVPGAIDPRTGAPFSLEGLKGAVAATEESL
jgi:2-amino-4-hydroxy-6-hydroxymethyldihydropteridine diphosphokinase